MFVPKVRMDSLASAILQINVLCLTAVMDHFRKPQFDKELISDLCTVLVHLSFFTYFTFHGDKLKISLSVL